MPGMMRSRKSGCLCADCDGPLIATRASDKRAWTDWRDEYETDPINECVDECPRDHRPCPYDADLCCTATSLAAMH